jgi:hypothetical protein
MQLERRLSGWRVLDQNKDASVTKAEFTQGFARLFDTWNTDKSGYLTLQQLRAGIEKDLSPSSGGSSPFGGGPGDPGRPGDGGLGRRGPGGPDQRRNAPIPEQRPLINQQP